MTEAELISNAVCPVAAAFCERWQHPASQFVRRFHRDLWCYLRPNPDGVSAQIGHVDPRIKPRYVPILEPDEFNKPVLMYDRLIGPLRETHAIMTVTQKLLGEPPPKTYSGFWAREVRPSVMMQSPISVVMTNVP